jgi:L-lactate dehydrogenase complex protein LldG
MYEERTTREKILKKIRKALINKSASVASDVDFDTDILQKPSDSLEVIFAQQLTKLNGKFIYCANEKELISNLSSLVKDNHWGDVFTFENPIKEILKKAEVTFSDERTSIPKVNVGISYCEYLAARTGSVFVTSKQISGRQLPAFANYHIVIAYSSQLVYTIKEALSGIKQKYGKDFPSMIVTISGPSRTADIEKTLVQGAHGPKEIYVLLVEKQ